MNNEKIVKHIHWGANNSYRNNYVIVLWSDYTWEQFNLGPEPYIKGKTMKQHYNFGKAITSKMNVVEVYYSGSHDNYFARVVNDDPNSPTSTVNRGREIVHRETDPQFSGEPTNRQVKDYATSLLSQLSSVEYTISYSHGYCPVRLYDCVRLNYERAGLMDIKAKVTRQSIECKPGCKVTETAVFTTNLWR